MGDLRYCFEQDRVYSTLKRTKSKGLAVIDSEGIAESTIRDAIKRGVFIYDYLNAGALEQERSYYNQFKHLRLAKYDGWNGEYWVDVTDKAWQNHLVEEARKKKAKGAIGLYFDNSDIYYMCKEGFKEEKSKMMRTAPSAEAVYKALRNVVKIIVEDVGLIVMPNGGNDFVEKMDSTGYGYLIKTVNQEGVCYTDQKPTPSDDKKYYTKYLNKMKKRGRHIRVIEYPKTKAQAMKALAYAKLHGWSSVYISFHKNLEGD